MLTLPALCCYISLLGKPPLWTMDRECCRCHRKEDSRAKQEKENTLCKDKDTRMQMTAYVSVLFRLVFSFAIICPKRDLNVFPFAVEFF